MKASVAFQSRSGTDSQLGPSDVGLSSADLRGLKARVGSYVAVQGPESSGVVLLCRAWLSKKLVGTGTITLNRVWWPSFGGGEQQARGCTVSRDTSAFKITPCSSVVFSARCSGAAGGELSFTRSPLFLAYVLGCLEGVPLACGAALGLTWKGSPVVIEVLRCSGAASEPDEGRSLRYLVDQATSVIFEAATSSDALSSPGKERERAQAQQEEEQGYASEAREVWQLTRLGLGLGSSGRRLALLSSPPSSQSQPSLSAHLFKPPRGLLLHGAPGTGKSSLLRAIVRRAKCDSVSLSPSLLLLPHAGEAEAELRRVFAYAAQHAPCCVLIDDADLLCRKRSEAGTTPLQRRVVACLLALLDGVAPSSSSSSSGAGVFVLAATSRPASLDPALRRPGRLDKELELPVPSAAQREALLRSIVGRGSAGRRAGQAGSGALATVTDAGLAAAAARAHGLVAADLLLLVKEAHLSALARGRAQTQGREGQEGSELEKSLSRLSLSPLQTDPTPTPTPTPAPITTLPPLQVLDADLLEALTRVRPSALREVVVEVPRVLWTDIGGMDSVKQSLKEVVEWPLRHASDFALFGLQAPRGVLLYGPPGCSKTLMAKALATESGMNFLAVRGPELLSKWLGESEKAVQALFRRARAAAPSVVFFDEVDALAGRRGAGSAGVNDRVLAQLLAELDGVGTLETGQGQGQGRRVIVVAATNRPDLLDPALIRPGRIDRKVLVPPPDAASRLSILLLELARVPTASSGPLAPDLPLLQALTEGFSGAEVVAVVSEAAMLALDAGLDVVPGALLEESARKTKPQITKEMMDYYLGLSF